MLLFAWRSFIVEPLGAIFFFFSGFNSLALPILFNETALLLSLTSNHKITVNTILYPEFTKELCPFSFNEEVQTFWCKVKFVSPVFRGRNKIDILFINSAKQGELFQGCGFRNASSGLVM